MLASLIHNLGIEKFWFVQAIIRNPQKSQAAEDVFNEMIDDSRKRQLMMNIFYEAKGTRDHGPPCRRKEKRGEEKRTVQDPGDRIAIIRTMSGFHILT